MIRRFWMPTCAGMTPFSAPLIASPAQESNLSPASRDLAQHQELESAGATPLTCSRATQR